MLRSHLYLFGATFFWGLNFHLAKGALVVYSPVQSAVVRYSVALVLLLVLLRPSVAGLWARLREAPLGLGLIGACLFGFNLLFFIGMQSSTPLNAALIVSLTPLMTLLLSWPILGQRLNGIALVGIGISLVGGLLLVCRADWQVLAQFRFHWGEMLILLANVSFALHHVYVKKYITEATGKSSTIVTTAICAVLLVLTLPALGEAAPPLAVPRTALLSILGIAVLGTAFAYYWWSLGVAELGAKAAAAYMNVVPLAAAAISVAKGDHLLPYHFLSAGLIFLGVFLILRRPRVVQLAVRPPSRLEP
jgi:drug/metabolite transporter (DMT)-like permease